MKALALALSLTLATSAPAAHAKDAGHSSNSLSPSLMPSAPLRAPNRQFTGFLLSNHPSLQLHVSGLYYVLAPDTATGARNILKGATAGNGRFHLVTTRTCPAPCGKHDVRGTVETNRGLTFTLIGERIHRFLTGILKAPSGDKVGHWHVTLSRPLDDNGIPLIKPPGCHGATRAC